jgi:hypothetical protein
VDGAATGAWYFLSQFEDVTSLLGSFSGADPNPANAGQPWLFSDTESNDMLARVQGTSQAAVVLAGFGQWAGPAAMSGQQFPRLRVDIWVDPARDAGGNITESAIYTASRGLAVAQAIHHRLQRKDSDSVMFGDMCTIGCQALTFPPQFTRITPPAGGGDWLQRGFAYYGLTVAGWTSASV